MTAVVKHGNDSVSSTSVAGVSEEYLDIKGVELEQGEISSIRISCPGRRCAWWGIM